MRRACLPVWRRRLPLQPVHACQIKTATGHVYATYDAWHLGTEEREGRLHDDRPEAEELAFGTSDVQILFGERPVPPVPEPNHSAWGMRTGQA